MREVLDLKGRKGAGQVWDEKGVGGVSMGKEINPEKMQGDKDREITSNNRD